MICDEYIELESSESLSRAATEDVQPLPRVDEVDLGWGGATTRIEANSLRVKAIAQENTPADMPDWMSGAIDVLYANIGREHGFSSREDKASSGFHDSPVSSSQGDLETEAGDLPLVGLGSNGSIKRCYLWRDDNVVYVSETLDTTSYSDIESNYAKGWWVEDFHYLVVVNFVLTGSEDVHVQGHIGDCEIFGGTQDAIDWKIFPKRYASDFDAWHTDAFTFSYAGNAGNNTFAMTWGFFEIDLSVGGNNSINVRDSIAREIIGGGGNDTIDIRGHGAAADLIDLRNGGNNTIHTEVWTNIIGGHGKDYIVSQPTFNNGNGIRADLSAGGDNTVHLLGAASSVKVGAGNDTIEVTNQWNNGGRHGGNWSSATIDLSLGGNNRVDISGNTQTSGPTRAEITLGNDNDTIVAHDHTVVTILGASSTGNHTITLHGSADHPGAVHTGFGHTAINWNGGNYVFEFGSGDLAFTTGGDLYQRFVFDGSERTANDTLILNNWREGGVVYTGQGHTNVWLNYGIYDFHFGSGSVNMSVNGHHGFSTIHDAEGNVIVGRVDGQSPVAQAVHAFSAGEGVNLHYFLQLGGGIDKVQFYAGSGHYQVISSANADIFQLDILGRGGTEGATFEVFDFKWGTDQIMAANGLVYDEHLLTDGNTVRLQYMGEENGQHAFDVVAVRDFGAYDAGHVWMTIYSHDLPDLNFL